jgi:hypothetical protein
MPQLFLLFFLSCDTHMFIHKVNVKKIELQIVIKMT